MHAYFEDLCILCMFCANMQNSTWYRHQKSVYPNTENTENMVPQ